MKGEGFGIECDERLMKRWPRLMRVVMMSPSPDKQDHTTVCALPATFTLTSYRFTLVARQPLYLPPFKGSALRGGFGYAFKSVVCTEACREKCSLGNACPYGYVFETAPPEHTAVLRTFDAVPRPFIIEPPLDRRTDYAPGETLTFQVKLIGRASRFLTYFILAFQDLGERGLGKGRGRFLLSSVEAIHPLNGEPVTVFDRTERNRIRVRALPVEAPAIAARAAALPTDRLSLAFLTPTRLKHRGHWVRQGPPFAVLIKTLLGRISSLSYFHCGQQLEADFRGLIDRAAGVRLAAAETTWTNWARFSGKQRQRINLGGLVGPVTYEGDVRPYRPLLALGELVHVGKGTVFGNGQYQLDWGEGGVEELEA
jgi:hypothetical protein